MEATVREWIGHTAIDPDGTKIGKISDVYVDDETGRPEWLAVKTGLFGTHVSFVPLEGATADGDDIRLAFSKDVVKDAPHADPDGHLEPAEEQALYRHYRGGNGNRTDGHATEHVATQGRGTQGRAGGDERASSDDAMTRSEEQLRVGKDRQETGRVRLRKYVETEHEQVTVPVQREQVRVEREPITEANRGAAMSGPDISEAEHEVVLHEEQPVVDKQTVPKERVRLGTDTETDEESVEADLRKERIETDTDKTRDR
jgi:uncharacterized protein (TIGR02271 family)